MVEALILSLKMLGTLILSIKLGLLTIIILWITLRVIVKLGVSLVMVLLFINGAKSLRLLLSQALVLDLDPLWNSLRSWMTAKWESGGMEFPIYKSCLIIIMFSFLRKLIMLIGFVLRNLASQEISSHSKPLD